MPSAPLSDLPPATLDELPTPTILVDVARLNKNIMTMQAACDSAHVELRPHVKTHKMIEVGRLQLRAGATGFTCAKLSEAEALLPCGVRRIFLAYPLVDSRQARRIVSLTDQLDEFRVAATSLVQANALNSLARIAGRRLQVMIAVDTGLGREGVRSLSDAERLAAFIAHCPHMELRGFYTHEGHLYGAPIREQAECSCAAVEKLCAIRDMVDKNLPVWPGCSVNATRVLETRKVQAVRPGAYVFGDLMLAHQCCVMERAAVALHVLATVVDVPEPGLALVDAGSKTLSGDRTQEGVHALAADGRDLAVTRVNEEHGYLTGTAIHTLTVGDRILLIPAHVCPVINLANEIIAVHRNGRFETWLVDARGRVK